MATEEYVTRADMRSFAHRVYVAFAALAISVAVGLALGVHERNDRIKDAAKVAAAARVIAKHAATKADHAQTLATIRSEDICSRTNQGRPCRLLFDRLAKNLSKAQRQRLACDGLAALHGPTVTKIRQESHCPKPLRSP